MTQLIVEYDPRMLICNDTGLIRSYYQQWRTIVVSTAWWRTQRVTLVDTVLETIQNDHNEILR
jgi:hypothetical protein